MECHSIWNAVSLVTISFRLWILGRNSTEVVLCSPVYISPRVAYWCKVSCWIKCTFSDLPTEKLLPPLCGYRCGSGALGDSADLPFFLSYSPELTFIHLCFWIGSWWCIFTPIILSSLIGWHFIVKKELVSSFQVIDSEFIQKGIIYYCHHLYSFQLSTSSQQGLPSLP